MIENAKVLASATGSIRELIVTRMPASSAESPNDIRLRESSSCRSETAIC